MTASHSGRHASATNKNKQAVADDDLQMLKHIRDLLYTRPQSPGGRALYQSLSEEYGRWQHYLQQRQATDAAASAATATKNDDSAASDDDDEHRPDAAQLQRLRSSLMRLLALEGQYLSQLDHFQCLHLERYFYIYWKKAYVSEHALEEFAPTGLLDACAPIEKQYWYFWFLKMRQELSQGLGPGLGLENDAGAGASAGGPLTLHEQFKNFCDLVGDPVAENALYGLANYSKCPDITSD